MKWWTGVWNKCVWKLFNILSVPFQERNKVYSRILGLRPPNLFYFGSRSPQELLKASGLTQVFIQSSSLCVAQLLWYELCLLWWTNLVSMCRTEMGLQRNLQLRVFDATEHHRWTHLQRPVAVSCGKSSPSPHDSVLYLWSFHYKRWDVLVCFFISLQFPWVLCDYTSPILDLEDPSVFRDLSKPIGVVNPRHAQNVREK